MGQARNRNAGTGEQVGDVMRRGLALHRGVDGEQNLPDIFGAGAFDVAKIGEAGEVTDKPFVSPVKDFYLTNAVARASKTMAEGSALKNVPAAQAAE